MAAKEATVYIVDCGRSMGETSAGRKHSNLDWALEYVWDKLTSTIATSRKTLLAAVVGLRTDGQKNMMEDEDGYQHISVFRDLAQLLMPDLRRLRDELIVSNSDAGDAISALVIAIQMIATTCKKLQYLRKIVLVTDARAPMDTENLSQITEKIKQDSIELVVLGVDFDDADFGVKEENKDGLKAENETILKSLCEDCNGTFGTLAQAIDEMTMPRVKSVKPTHSFKGQLTLGNPEEYEDALSIGIERYPKVMQASAPTASKFVVKAGMTASQATASTETLNGGDDLAAVKNARTYHVEDENAPGGKKEVEYDELSKGYEYGRTAVHISESDRNVTTYETFASMDIIGFVPKERFERYLEINRTNLIVASRGDDKQSMALSAIIHALYELDDYAIARLVTKDNQAPSIRLLAPHIDPEFECLYDGELPFAEDIRSYKFPPLDRVVTVSGKVLTIHRNLPSDDLQDAIDAYVDSMDLSTFGGNDDEGAPTEYAPMDETFSPMLHRINQVIKHRAIYPSADPPEPYEILTRYSHPPAELVKQSQRALDKAIKAADVKKVPPKARGKRFGKKQERDQPLSGLNVDALLAQNPQRRAKRIDPNNAVPEFKQIIHDENLSDETVVEDAYKQLMKIVEGWIRHSVGSSGYGRAVEALRVMREECLELELPEVFNKRIKELKTKLLGGELGDERKDMWYEIRVHKLGLISRREIGVSSKVEDEEAKAFLSAK